MNAYRLVNIAGWSLLILLTGLSISNCAMHPLPNSLEDHALSDPALGRIQEANR